MEVITSVAQVLSMPKYFAIAALSALFVFSLNLLAPNYQILLSKPALLGDIFIGTLTSIAPFFQFVSITISILAGILISLMLFKSHSGEISGKEGAGIALGLFAPACASCGIGLMAVLGLGGAFLSLPFKGLEISALAIVLIAAGIISTAKSLGICKQCQVKLRK